MRSLGAVSLLCLAVHGYPHSTNTWLKIDDFESGMLLNHWVIVETQNEMRPKVENPQITLVRIEEGTNSRYLLKNPAADRIVGNRKAIGFKMLQQVQRQLYESSPRRE